MRNLYANNLAKLIEDNLSAKSQDFAGLAGGQVHDGKPTCFCVYIISLTRESNWHLIQNTA